MSRNSLRIQDTKLLTFGQVSNVLNAVIEDYEQSCLPDNDLDSCLAVSDVVNRVTACLEKELRETLLGVAEQLHPAKSTCPPWAQPQQQAPQQPHPAQSAIHPWMQGAAPKKKTRKLSNTASI